MVILIGKRLRELRGSESQQVIADKLGVSRARYSHYETERVEPDLALLKRMAKLFSVTTDYLIGKSDDPNLTENQEEERDSQSEEWKKLWDSLSKEERQELMRMGWFITNNRSD